MYNVLKRTIQQSNLAIRILYRYLYTGRNKCLIKDPYNCNFKVFETNIFEGTIASFVPTKNKDFVIQLCLKLVLTVLSRRYTISSLCT